MERWKKQICGPRRVAVTHPDGHRFYFEFPEGWDGGHVPRYQPVTWANNLPPANSWIEAEAAIEAVTAARAQGWVYRSG